MTDQKPTLALVALLIFAGTLPHPAFTAPEEPKYVFKLRMPARADTFKQPRAVAVDLLAQEIFISDTLNNRIVIFDNEGHFRYQIPGGSSFRAPVDLAVHPDGYIFVASLVSRSGGVILLDFDGKLLNRIELSGVPETLDTPSLTSIALSPCGDRLYAVDSANLRLWILDSQGTVLKSIDLAEGLTDEERRDFVVENVDVYDDTVLLSVPSDGKVHLFDLDGRPKGQVGIKGTATCQTMFPVAAALDATGQVIILDKQRAMFMTWDPDTNTCLSEHSGFGNAPGAFYQPGDLALDASGTIYVSQGFEGRVQVFEGAAPAAMRSIACNSE